MNFFTGLGLIFITLKLTEVILWSWWLVLLPLYGIPLLVLLLSILILSCGGSVSINGKKVTSKSKVRREPCQVKHKVLTVKKKK